MTTMELNDRPRLGGMKVSKFVLSALGRAIECGDLATMDAAYSVIESAHRDGLPAMADLWSRDDGGLFVDWLMVTAPVLKGKLKKATGRTRDEWLWLV